MKNAFRTVVVLVAMVGVFSAGCGTTYTPRNTGRIRRTMSFTGEETLEKDGKRFTFGVFTGTLSEAVAGNPAATEEMDSYMRHKRIAGGLGALAGISCAIGYLAIINRPRSDDNSGDTQAMLTIAGASLLGGIAALIGAGVALDTGEHHLYDAVNIYNDGLAGK